MPNAGEILDAPILQEGSYTPVLTAGTTNPTLGAGAVQSGSWQRVGNLIVCWASIAFGSSGVAAGSGTYFVSLPFPADTTFMIATLTTAGGSVIGDCSLRDNSAPAAGGGWAQLADTADKVWLRNHEASGTGAGNVSNAAPWVWAASDRINVFCAYKADPNSLL